MSEDFMNLGPGYDRIHKLQESYKNEKDPNKRHELAEKIKEIKTKYDIKGFADDTSSDDFAETAIPLDSLKKGDIVYTPATQFGGLDEAGKYMVGSLPKKIGNRNQVKLITLAIPKGTGDEDEELGKVIEYDDPVLYKLPVYIRNNEVKPISDSDWLKATDAEVTQGKRMCGFSIDTHMSYVNSLSNIDKLHTVMFSE